MGRRAAAPRPARPREGVAAGIRRRATARPLGRRPRRDKAVPYLTNNHAYMDYDKALANGWPIATGVIEGACRHIVREIHRVLRPGGELVIMMYARWSLNYLVSIGLIRRAVLLGAFPLAQVGILRAIPPGARWPPISAMPGR